MEPIRVIGEKQSCGGPGRFFLGRAEELGAELAEKYAGTARLIYLDIITTKTIQFNYPILSAS